MAKKIRANTIHRHIATRLPQSCLEYDRKIGRAWGSWYVDLAKLARKLGWNGAGEFWGLCSFVDVLDNIDSDDQQGIDKLAKQIKNRLNRLAKHTKPTIKKNVTLH